MNMGRTASNEVAGTVPIQVAGTVPIRYAGEATVRSFAIASRGKERIKTCQAQSEG